MITIAYLIVLLAYVSLPCNVFFSLNAFGSSLNDQQSLNDCLSHQGSGSEEPKRDPSDIAIAMVHLPKHVQILELLIL
ncbi:uncharacterized protein UDID_19569 [Ustilago sp. UG-2017a]|nr:uncharacterized protein UDID_19569 [Ustilago sp. UG-2017a]